MQHFKNWLYEYLTRVSYDIVLNSKNKLQKSTKPKAGSLTG